ATTVDSSGPTRPRSSSGIATTRVIPSWTQSSTSYGLDSLALATRTARSRCTSTASQRSGRSSAYAAVIGSSVPRGSPYEDHFLPRPPRLGGSTQLPTGHGSGDQDHG